MISKIKNNIFKFYYSSNFYYYKDLDLLIDTGCKCDQGQIQDDFEKNGFDMLSIKYIVFTHLHYDHTGNFNLFKNARFFTSKQAIIDFKNCSSDSVLDPYLANKLENIDLEDISEFPYKDKFEIIYTPGHTKGSICLLDNINKILFSGDTLFNNLVLGRYDLPTSSPVLYKESMNKVSKLDYDLLCPGHDY